MSDNHEPKAIGQKMALGEPGNIDGRTPFMWWGQVKDGDLVYGPDTMEAFLRERERANIEENDRKAAKTRMWEIGKQADELQEKLTAVEAECAALRTMLFLKTVGHPEHHHSWACGACNDLRASIDLEIENQQ